MIIKEFFSRKLNHPLPQVRDPPSIGRPFLVTIKELLLTLFEEELNF